MRTYALANSVFFFGRAGGKVDAGSAGSTGKVAR